MAELQFRGTAAAAGYDQSVGVMTRRIVPSLLRVARLAPGMRVLDIATGTGLAAEAALDTVGPTGRVTAVDDTPAMLDRARRRLGDRPNVSFAVGRAGSLDLPDAGFDAVLCSMALMIFPDRAGALSEFRRALRDGGRAATSINTTPERSLTGRVRVAVARRVPSMRAALAHHYSLSDADRLRALLGAAGFRDVEVFMESRPFSFPSFDTQLPRSPVERGLPPDRLQ